MVLALSNVLPMKPNTKAQGQMVKLSDRQIVIRTLEQTVQRHSTFSWLVDLTRYRYYPVEKLSTLRMAVAEQVWCSFGSLRVVTGQTSWWRQRDSQTYVLILVNCGHDCSVMKFAARAIYLSLSPFSWSSKSAQDTLFH